MEIFRKIADILFPARCVCCNKMGQFICKKCREKIIVIGSQTCPKCNKISPKGAFCPRCRPKSLLSGITSCGYFKDPILKKAIHAYKYDKYSAMCPELTGFMSQKIKEEDLKFDILVPVPISRKRRSWRGFNQSELLAKEIAKEFKKPVFLDLRKVKDTKTQVGLKKREREQNLKDALKCGYKENITGKKILLIDDVVTTGTTLNECAKLLKKSGARSVWAIVMAKE